ncbi:hypothetical protein PHYSODRAFT_295421 [Phytophthora sojae]|uniref:Uncharacterized protein n=1 Tax=Phytophthora sojae (strain P6497) TaxID=1094619 RepID=G4YNY3_PHYSP|nr:hypothetical protein PHYSODRAFT_295421 [Phytophthora sojae]EGZ30743.1 hypothetical protein PHYSODRAFT_295421 [Phytophthora sojae]|eukprot:XP_009518018.1 hypothetical protein PHYSODRAFT_295421 [Phytophthora sojae]
MLLRTATTNLSRRASMLAQFCVKCHDFAPQDVPARLRSKELEAELLFRESIWWEHRRKLNRSLVSQAREATKCSLDEDEFFHEDSDEEDRVDDDDDFVRCSAIKRWRVETIYERLLRTDPAAFDLPQIESDRFAKLLENLRRTERLTSSSAFGFNADVGRIKESVQEVLFHVKTMFERGELSCIRRPLISSRTVLSKGIPSWLVESKKRKILVVVVAHDLYEGQARALVLMDIALGINEEKEVPSDSIHGIVTDYHRWMFLKRTPNEIACCNDFIIEATEDADVARVARRLYGIFEEGINYRCGARGRRSPLWLKRMFYKFTGA